MTDTMRILDSFYGLKSLLKGGVNNSTCSNGTEKNLSIASETLAVSNFHLDVEFSSTATPSHISFIDAVGWI